VSDAHAGGWSLSSEQVTEAMPPAARRSLVTEAMPQNQVTYFMLKAVVESVDELPEGLKDLYKQIENGENKGKFLLNVEPVEGYSLDNLDNLKNALGTTKGELESAKSALEGFKGLDAKSVRDGLKELERLRKIDPESEAGKLAEERAAAQVGEVTKRFELDIAARDSRNALLEKELTRQLVENTAKAAITAQKGVPELLLQVVTSRMKVVETDGQFSVQVVDNKGVQDWVVKEGTTVPTTVDDLVAKLKANPIYGRAFDAEVKSGGGATGGVKVPGGSSKINPWMPTKASPYGNITEQMKMMREEPALAAAFQEQAKAARGA